MELPAAVEATSFADSAVEAAYQEARTRFVAARPTASGGAWLVVSLVAFAAIELAQSRSIAKLILLVAVLLFHELGHFVGMVGLGYRDVRMFFLPLFGAAVSGRRGGGSQTREAIVLLLGPVPGIGFGVSAPKAGAKVAADWMAQVLDTACRRAPSVGRSLALSAVWAAAFVVGLVALALVVAMK